MTFIGILEKINKVFSKKVNSVEFSTDKYIDITSSITKFDGTSNVYVAPSNGYVFIGSNGSQLDIFNYNGFGNGGTHSSQWTRISHPLKANESVNIQIQGTLTFARFYPF